MFDYIKGVLINKSYPYCTIECNNIGYVLLINQRTYANLCEINNEIKIYTKLIHKEDSMTLCGFKNREDRVIFDILTSVSGIGIKVAFSLLDEFETAELINAVIDEDYKLISKTKGVGLKMAQKIILELKDKLTKIDTSTEILSSKTNNLNISKETITQAQTILQSLGYSQNEYQNALEIACKKLEKNDPQELLKNVLEMLSIF